MSNQPSPQDDDPETKSLQALLGSDAKNGHVSKELIQLKIEKEKTLQEKYKLDAKNTNYRILQEAIKNNVPTHLYPLLFDNQHTAAPSSFPSSSKNPPVDALGLSGTRYHHHQRNLSLPQQPTVIHPDYAPYPPRHPHPHHPPPPPPPTHLPPQHHQQPTYRHHTHHSSISAIPQPRVYPNNTGSTSVHPVIQFHHWQPSPSSSEETPQPKRRRSGSPSASPSRKATSMHSRNRSETTAIRTDLTKMSLDGAPALGPIPAEEQSQEQSSPSQPRKQSQPQDSASSTSSGGSIGYLATVAAAEQEQARSHKQNVNFMISEKE